MYQICRLVRNLHTFEIMFRFIKTSSYQAPPLADGHPLKGINFDVSFQDEENCFEGLC